VFFLLPETLARRLFRSFETAETFLDEVAEIRRKFPDRKFIFLVFDAGLVELLALRYFFNKRWGDHFVVRRALGFPDFWVNPLSETIKRWLSNIGLIKKKFSLAKICQRELNEGHPLVVNLTLGFRAGKITGQEKLLEYLVQTQKDVVLVPIVFIWRRVGRKLEIKDEALSSKLLRTIGTPILAPWHILFGDSQRPLGMRKILVMLRGYSRSTVRVASVIEAGPDTNLQTFRRESIRAIQKEKRAVLGPVYKPVRGVWDQILRSPDFDQFTKQLAIEESVSETKILKKAESILKEIASDYSYAVIELAGWILEKVFHSIYQGFTFDREQLRKVRETSKDAVIVFVPNHRSYLDFLVLSYFLFREQMPPPHVAAGINLNFWPAGTIFKGGGGFFIRRSFRGDKLYSEILRRYVITLLNNRLNLEFFIEGMRSRVGKMTPPKYGILKMIVDGHTQKKITEKIYFVPVSITYDRVTEDKAHKRELEGGAKAKENAFNAISGSIKVLLKRYGRVHLRFGDPLSLDTSLETLKTSAPPEKDFSRWAVPRIAFDLCHRINSQTPVTAAGLVCTVMISRPGAALSRQELEKWLMQIEKDLTLLNISKEPELEMHYMSECNRALARLVSEGLVQEYQLQDGGQGLRIVESERMVALYYRNTAIHAFLVPALWGMARRNEERALELRSLLRFEFFFQGREEFLTSLRLIPEDMPCEFYAYLLEDVIENTLWNMNYLKLRTDLKLEEKEWASRFLKYGQEKLMEGEIRRRESVNTYSIKAFLEMAKNEEWMIHDGGKALGVSLNDEFSKKHQQCRDFLSSLTEWSQVKEKYLK